MSHRRAMTLIELLAVVAILAIIGSLGAVGLSSTAREARLRGAVVRWQDLDVQARLMSRVDGPVTMMVSADGRSVHVRHEATGEVLAAVDLPAGVSATLESTDAAVRFDRLGRSADYRARLLAAERRHAWRVCGLSGAVVEVE